MEAQEASERVIESAPITRLHEAAISGDVNSFKELVKKHPRILDMERCLSKQSSLLIAVKLGRLELAREIVHQNPQLANDVDESQRLYSPLHIASQQGDLDMVTLLLSMSPAMCLARDHDGNNPVHLAAIMGHKDVLGVLLRAMPLAARERTASSDTILHLCVKHCQLETLEFLIEEMDNVVDGLLESTDNDDNTLLHLAVFAKQPPMVEYLVNKKVISKNAINKNGMTAMDTCKQRKAMDNDQQEILQSLRHAGAVCAKQILPISSLRALLESLRAGLMVAASMIATMAFQFGINPPGGTWQDGPLAGQSILAHKDPYQYNLLLASNTTAMCSSLFAVLILFRGWPHESLHAIILILFVIIIAVYATLWSYAITVNTLSPNMKGYKIGVYLFLIISSVSWIVGVVLKMVGRRHRFVKWIQKLGCALS